MKVRLNLANVDMICDMGSALDDGDSAINMGIDDWERTHILSIELFGCFVIKNEAFIAWLVVVVMAFFVCSLKVVINDNLSAFL
jgi:hypothetical protein